MNFYSILFREPGVHDRREAREAPAFFRDLNVDQIVQAITAAWQDYDLVPFFNAPLNDVCCLAHYFVIHRHVFA